MFRADRSGLSIGQKRQRRSLLTWQDKIHHTRRRNTRGSSVRLGMKRNGAAIIALVLWLLFVASNAFAVFKSPHPPKPYPPDQSIVVGVGEDDHGVVSAGEPK